MPIVILAINVLQTQGSNYAPCGCVIPNTVWHPVKHNNCDVCDSDDDCACNNWYCPDESNYYIIGL